MTPILMLNRETASYILNDKPPAARTRISSLLQNKTACISRIRDTELILAVEKLDLRGKRQTLSDCFCPSSVCLRGLQNCQAIELNAAGCSKYLSAKPTRPSDHLRAGGLVMASRIEAKGA